MSNIEKLLRLYDKIGKLPYRKCKHMDVMVEFGEDRFFVTEVKYNNKKSVSLKVEKISCETCKNNPRYNNGYSPPHTCDICTSLDSEDYEMWELKE